MLESFWLRLPEVSSEEPSGGPQLLQAYGANGCPWYPGAGYTWDPVSAPGPEYVHLATCTRHPGCAMSGRRTALPRNTSGGGFGVIHGPKPYKFIGFGDPHGPKPYKFIGSGDPHGPKPYKFIKEGRRDRSPGSKDIGSLVGQAWRNPDAGYSWEPGDHTQVPEQKTGPRSTRAQPSSFITPKGREGGGFEAVSGRRRFVEFKRP